MRNSTLVLTALLATPTIAYAQAPAPTVQDITVSGVTDVLAEYVRTMLSVQVGDPVAGLDAKALEQEVLASGFFKSATVTVSNAAGRTVLNIAVVPNATVKTVEVTGMTFLPTDAFVKQIEERYSVGAGATLNTARLEQIRDDLVKIYRSEGYPFDPQVTVQQKANADGTVTVVYNVVEKAPITRIEVRGVTLVPAQTVSNIFKPLHSLKEFDAAAYYQSVMMLDKAYADAGYMGAGVNRTASTLKDGVLTIQVVEGKLSELDLSALELPSGSQPALQLKVGQTPKLEQMEADIRTLANLTGQPVTPELGTVGEDPTQLVVRMVAAEVQSGPIKSVQFTGNTLLTGAQLAQVLKMKAGDTYTPTLAQRDFMALRDAYRKAGYDISTRDAITFENGVLTYNIHEVRLTGYELQWQGEHQTKDRVVLRELPKPGGYFNLNDLRAGLLRVRGLEFVQIVGEATKSPNPERPEDVVYVLKVADNTKGAARNLGFSLGYTSAEGFDGQLNLSTPNLFGLGHRAQVGISAGQNDVKQNWSGSLSYAIPWIDADFLDFRENRTSVSAGVFSTVTGNVPLKDKTTTPSKNTGYEYTQRSTGFSVSMGRNLTPNLTAAVGAKYAYNTYYLEPLNDKQKENAERYSSADAQAVLPQNSKITTLYTDLNFDNVNYAPFPSQGVRANAQASYNFGVSGEKGVGWTALSAGVRGYYGFGKLLDRGFDLKTHQQVFAVRLNGGTMFGSMPDGNLFRVGGGEASDPGLILRGVEASSLVGTNYFTTSAEYRYDFNVQNSVLQGVYGIAFADAGAAWNSGEQVNMQYGIGAGVMVSIAGLPLRFDYTFNPTTNQWKPKFGVGISW